MNKSFPRPTGSSGDISDNNSSGRVLSGWSLVNENRRVAGLYVDLETDINDHFLINVAGRYENYNDFGNNLAGKLAMRYKFSSAFSLRGSVSNGYHAPALQQIYYSASLSGYRKVGGS